MYRVCPKWIYQNLRSQQKSWPVREAIRPVAVREAIRWAPVAIRAANVGGRTLQGQTSGSDAPQMVFKTAWRSKVSCFLKEA